MVNEVPKKRYKIYRSVSSSINTVPSDNQFYSENNYTHIATVDVDTGTTPSYIDNSSFAYCNEFPDGSCPPTCWESRNARYRIQAIDVYDDHSVLSDFIKSRIYINNNGGTPSETDNPVNQIEVLNIPKEFSLFQNYPNPFNPITNIQYDIPVGNFVVLKIYDVNGREVKTLINEFKPAGRYLYSFNASELSSGIYFYKIIAGNFIETKRMVLIK
ncbi:MAG: T9SS type A sorting domain-containing protein [Ignavibacteria bacterium]|nr:T9SS type A sorting domain-containing protein [Ignavibacteria bacterium]HCN36982.1 hypothetical protein [Bacteroidota bacterium]